MGRNATIVISSDPESENDDKKKKNSTIIKEDTSTTATTTTTIDHDTSKRKSKMKKEKKVKVNNKKNSLSLSTTSSTSSLQKTIKMKSKDPNIPKMKKLSIRIKKLNLKEIKQNAIVESSSPEKKKKKVSRKSSVEKHEVLKVTPTKKKTPTKRNSINRKINKSQETEDKKVEKSIDSIEEGKSVTKKNLSNRKANRSSKKVTDSVDAENVDQSISSIEEGKPTTQKNSLNRKANRRSKIIDSFDSVKSDSCTTLVKEEITLYEVISTSHKISEDSPKVVESTASEKLEQSVSSDEEDKPVAERISSSCKISEDSADSEKVSQSKSSIEEKQPAIKKNSLNKKANRKSKKIDLVESENVDQPVSSIDEEKPIIKKNSLNRKIKRNSKEIVTDSVESEKLDQSTNSIDEEKPTKKRNSTIRKVNKSLEKTDQSTRSIEKEKKPRKRNAIGRKANKNSTKITESTESGKGEATLSSVEDEKMTLNHKLYENTTAINSSESEELVTSTTVEEEKSTTKIISDCDANESAIIESNDIESDIIETIIQIEEDKAEITSSINDENRIQTTKLNDIISEDHETSSTTGDDKMATQKMSLNNEKSATVKRSRNNKSPIFIRLPLAEKSNKCGKFLKMNKKEKIPNQNYRRNGRGRGKRSKLGKSYLKQTFGSRFFSCHISVKRLVHPNLESFRKERKNNRKTVSFVEEVEIFSYYSPNGKVASSSSIQQSKKDQYKNGNRNFNGDDVVHNDVEIVEEEISSKPNQMGNTSTPVKKLPAESNENEILSKGRKRKRRIQEKIEQNEGTTTTTTTENDDDDETSNKLIKRDNTINVEEIITINNEEELQKNNEKINDNNDADDNKEIEKEKEIEIEKNNDSNNEIIINNEEQNQLSRINFDDIEISKLSNAEIENIEKDMNDVVEKLVNGTTESDLSKVNNDDDKLTKNCKKSKEDEECIDENNLENILNVNHEIDDCKSIVELLAEKDSRCHDIDHELMHSSILEIQKTLQSIDTNEQDLSEMNISGEDDINNSSSSNEEKSQNKDLNLFSNMNKRRISACSDTSTSTVNSRRYERAKFPLHSLERNNKAENMIQDDKLDKNPSSLMNHRERSRTPTGNGIHGRKSYRTDKSPITVTLDKDQQIDEILAEALSQGHDDENRHGNNLKGQNKIFNDDDGNESTANSTYESFENLQELNNTLELNSNNKENHMGNDKLTKDSDESMLSDEHEVLSKLSKHDSEFVTQRLTSGKLPDDLINDNTLLTDEEDIDLSNHKSKCNDLLQVPTTTATTTTTTTTFDDDSDDSLLQSLNNISSVDTNIKSTTNIDDLFEVVKRSEAPKDPRLIGMNLNRNSTLNQLNSAMMKTNDDVNTNLNLNTTSLVFDSVLNDPNMSSTSAFNNVVIGGNHNKDEDTFSDADEFMATNTNLNDDVDVGQLHFSTGTNDNVDIIMNQVDLVDAHDLVDEQNNKNCNINNDKNDTNRFSLNKYLKIFN